LARRLLPFAVAAALVLTAAAAPQGPSHPQLFVLTLALSAGLVAASLAVRWSTWPRAAQAVPVYVSFGLIALARHAIDGSASGLSPLVLLPVVWLALYESRREVIISLVLAGCTIAAPLVVVGAPAYTGADWRKAVIMTSVSALAAFVVSRAVEELAGQKRAAERLAERLAASEANLAAVSAAARALQVRDDVRPSMVQFAIAVTGADIAQLLEPDGAGSLAQTATVGWPLAPVHLPLGSQTSGAVRAFTSGKGFVAEDAGSDPRVSHALVEAAGIRSAAFEPLFRDGEPVGVLVVAWTSRLQEGDRRAMALVPYALEAAVALERADGLRALRRAAEHDGLTGAANRRALDLILSAELPVHGETERAILMIDFDHFKVYNDSHGHAAGDLLLKEAVARWQDILREEDLVARYGGEEFAVLLRGCSPVEVRAVAERLQMATPAGQTVSIGLACARPDEGPDHVLGRADRALYAAKRAGRNRVMAAG
jgi:diguanylate cyclase (GGDEF)-like protein